MDLDGTLISLVGNKKRKMHKITFFGYSWHKGLNLKATIFNQEAQIAYSDLDMTETSPNSGIFIFDLYDLSTPLQRGRYTIKIFDSEDMEEFYEFGWDGLKFSELSDSPILNMSEDNIKELRDAVGSGTGNGTFTVRLAPYASGPIRLGMVRVDYGNNQFITIGVSQNPNFM